MRYLKIVCRCMASMGSCTRRKTRLLRSIIDGILGRIGRREHLVLYRAGLGGLSLSWRPDGSCTSYSCFLTSFWPQITVNEATFDFSPLSDSTTTLNGHAQVGSRWYICLLTASKVYKSSEDRESRSPRPELNFNPPW